MRSGVNRSHTPRRHWRGYGNDPLPSGAAALDEPFNAFPSWFLRVECDRCGKVRTISETPIPVPDAPATWISADGARA